MTVDEIIGSEEAEQKANERVMSIYIIYEQFSQRLEMFS